MKSFSLIELIVVVAIIISFSSLALFNYSKTSNEAVLNKTGKQLTDVIYLAKQKAISNDLGSCPRQQFTGYKVRINQENFVLQQCCPNCGVNDATLVAYDLPTGIIRRSGVNEIQFNHDGSVTPSSGGSIILESTALTGNGCFRLDISPQGVINVSDTLVSCS